MLTKLWELLLEYVKEKGYWAALRPAVLVGGAFVGAQVLAFQYLQWQYGFAPPLWLFLRSYIFQRIALAFVVLLLAAVAFRFGPGVPVLARWRRIHRYARIYRRTILYRASVLVISAALLVGGCWWLSPRAVTHITIKFLDEPLEVNVDALAYLIYELNRQQRSWFFEVDFEPFNPESLRTTDQKDCRDSPRPLLCYAEKWAAEWAGGRPAIALTEQPLGEAFFAEHRGNVSVITTADRSAYQPLTDYEYLVYSIVVQSMVLHLDSQDALPPDFFANAEATAATENPAGATPAAGTTTHGGVFQYNRRKEAMKSTILAAALSPREEELLFNQFGPEYLRNCQTLLAMEWLYSAEVTQNLQRFFGITLSRSSRAPSP